LPPLFPPSSGVVISEQQELLRRRTFSCRSIDDIYNVMATLKRERFIGSVTINFGPNNTLGTVKCEERAKLNA
jgi:hypothetical protein